MRCVNKYSALNDKELIEQLMATPPDEALHRYFFGIKCKQFLQFIATSIFNCDKETLLGEFYDFISQNNWYVLRSFDEEKGASLNTYLSRCTVRHFLELKRKKEKQENGRYSIEDKSIIEELNFFTAEEENEQPNVWRAFNRLGERDRIILRSLVIENKSAIEAADKIWPHVKSKQKEWRELPVKRVQDTIAILKRRALLALLIEIKEIEKSER